jgi:plastocyanin
MLKRILALAVVAALALAVAASALSKSNVTKLKGTVGPGFTITLTKGGKKVKSLKAGKYAITVRDKSNIHNFHLRGPGLNKTTSVSFVGTKTWTVTLKKGTYRFVCDPHASSMKGSFTVA